MNLAVLQTKIYETRGEKVMLDFDLAMLYEVETRVLNQAVKRNIIRFPDDFMFRLTISEWESMRSQIVTASQSKRNIGVTPFAFTEQGVAMLSSVLKSEKAVLVNIAIMRTFVEIRKKLSFQSEISQQMLSFKNEIEERLGEHDVQLLEIYTIMEQYLDKKSKQITIEGFKQQS
jgi:phage regulator Rha-like protein